MEPEVEQGSWASQHTGALIGAAATILAALIGGAFLLASQNSKIETTPSSLQASTPKIVPEEIKPQSAEKGNKISQAKIESKFELASYKDVYDFAYSAGGMNQTSSNATEFADLWFSKCREEDFDPFKEAYKFAYSAGGMNMTSSKAKAWAIGKIPCLAQ